MPQRLRVRALILEQAAAGPQSLGQLDDPVAMPAGDRAPNSTWARSSRWAASWSPAGRSSITRIRSLASDTRLSTSVADVR